MQISVYILNVETLNVENTKKNNKLLPHTAYVTIDNDIC